MNYAQLPDEVLPKVRSWSAMQLAIWADVHTMNKSGMIYYRTNEQLAERWQTDERTVRRVVKQLIECGAVTARQDGKRRILTATMNFETKQRTKRSTDQAVPGPTSPRTNQSAKGDQLVREGGPTGPKKGDQLVPQVEHRVEQEEEQVVERAKPKKEARPKSLEDVIEAFEAVGSTSDEAETFWNHFEANGWKQGGRAAMKDWRAAARNWIKRAPSFARTDKNAIRPAADGGHYVGNVYMPNIENIYKNG